MYIKSNNFKLILLKNLQMYKAFKFKILKMGESQNSKFNISNIKLRTLEMLNNSDSL